MDGLKLYKELKSEGRTDSEILDYMEHLESLEDCNRCHNFEGV